MAKKQKLPDQKEAEIMTQINNYLKYCKDIMHYRQNSGAVKVGNRYIRFTDRPGVADFTGCHITGRYIALEVKTRTGKQNANQKKFEEDVKKKNGVYEVVRSVDDVIKVLNRLRPTKKQLGKLLELYKEIEEAARR